MNEESIYLFTYHLTFHSKLKKWYYTPPETNGNSEKTRLTLDLE